MTTSILDDAFAHHVWATVQLIDACEALSEEQLRTPVPGTYGSIIDTLRHLVDADTFYLAVVSGGPEPRDMDEDASLEEMRSLITSHGTAWMELLAGEIDPDVDVVELDNGQEFHVPMGIRLAQAVHHGTDHRSQICTALTAVGVTPPDIDVWAFAEATGRQRVVAPTTS